MERVFIEGACVGGMLGARTISEGGRATRATVGGRSGAGGRAEGTGAETIAAEGMSSSSLSRFTTTQPRLKIDGCGDGGRAVEIGGAKDDGGAVIGSGEGVSSPKMGRGVCWTARALGFDAD
jgi:hypothetical protein